MNLLFRIVYAAHANGTHHKLALDALRHLQNPEAQRWQRLFLAHAEIYLEGSKAPDKEFKDFKNHVLHVGDNFWGGAPEKVESWYSKLVEALKSGSWHEAVYAAGIMSHYYTDPIHPFHTAQSPAENNIHRAVEWSISKSYGVLAARNTARALPQIDIADGENALKDHAIAGAETSHAHYETLIAHYNFERGVVNPPEGLDEISRELISELLLYAAVGHARLLDRAFAEAAVSPPDVKLTAETFVAALKIPLKWVTRKLEDAADRRQVEAMYDELTSTGTVENTLPADDRQVRELHDREVVTPRKQRQAEKRRNRRQRSPLPQGQIPKLASAVAAPIKSVRQTPPPSLKTALADATPASTQSVEQVAPENNRFAGPAAEPLARLRDRARNTSPQEQTSVPSSQPPIGTQPRCNLKPSDDLEAAPSIGPKTAKRFAAIGIYSVDDFLQATPALTADDLDTRHITEKTIIEWQQQAQLVCTLPGIRGGHAQLLVGAGLTSIEAIADTDPGEAMAAILRFAQTSAGQSVLRDGQPPDLEKIVTWVHNAKQVRQAA